MIDHEKIKRVSDHLIEKTDITYMAHYWYENLEGMMLDEIKDRINESLSQEEAEYVLHNVWRYIHEQIAKEEFDCVRYHFKPLLESLLIYLKDKIS